jgi:peptide/nickel transport system permease protein
MSIIIRRLTMSIPTLLLLSFLVFALLEMAPGDAAEAVLDPTISEAQAELVREELGLNRSFMSRYVDYVGGLLRGDMGHSVRSGLPVTEEIKIRLPYTLVLMSTALVLGAVMGTTLGAIAAFKRGTIWDTLVRALVSVNQATPTFWLAILMVSFFSLRLRWLPVFGADSPKHLVLPAFCTSLALVPGIARLTRASLLETLGSDFILTARSKGLRGRRILGRHISPIAAISIITYIGLQTVRLISSVTVMEIIFSWPGLGGMAVSAAFDRDPLLLQGTTLTIAAMIFVILFVIDFIVLALDPRISHKSL